MARQSIGFSEVSKNRLDHLAAHQGVSNGQIVDEAIRVYWHLKKLYPDGIIHLQDGSKIIF